MGPTAFRERDTTHFGWLHHAAAKSRSSGVSFRMVFVPIAHDLIHAAAVHTARQAAHVLYPVTKECGVWRKFLVVDRAVQGLIHSETIFAMLPDLQSTL